MTRSSDPIRLDLEDLPAGVHLLGPSGSNDARRGNLVFRCLEQGRDAILKLYRPRGGFLSERMADVSQRWVEGKRGIGAERRRETERAALSAWRQHGFDVPRVLDREPPGWIGGAPFLWLEFVAGETLREALSDSARPLAERLALVARLAADAGRRHRLALDTGETLLIQEHPAVQHVLVSGRRLVTFDLEQAYEPGFSLPRAIAHELSSTLRSFRTCGPAADAYFGVFVEAYSEPEILKESCRIFLGTSLRWQLYRLQESARRGARSKTGTMRRVSDQLASRRRG